MDHRLVNVYRLVMLREQGKRALLLDDYSEMELIGAEPVEIPERFPFYSLVNITGTARGIMETGCKFPLDNGEIRCDYQYGTSNEVLPGQTAVVSVKEGLPDTAGEPARRYSSVTSSARVRPACGRKLTY